MKPAIRDKIEVDIFLTQDAWIHLLEGAKREGLHINGYIVTVLEDVMDGRAYSHISPLEEG
jgi:hypothetical protein